MNLNKFLLIITVVCGIILCTNAQQKDKAAYIVDLDLTEAKGAFEMSKLFKNVRTIIVDESNENAIIGSIDAIKSFEDNIYILDRFKAKKLLVFDRNGKYLRQIGSRGQGPGEYLSIGDFTIDPNKKEIYILDNSKCTVHKHSINGKYIKSIQLQNNISYKDISLFNNKLYINICNFQDKNDPNKYLLMEVDLETEQCRKLLSADYNLGYADYRSTEFPVFLQSRESVKYAEQYMNTVIAINGNGVYPYLTVKHKNWALRNDLPDDPFYFSGKQEDSPFKLLNERSRAYYLHNYIENENYIYFEYFKGSTNTPVFYDKKTKQTSQFGGLKNDLILKKGNILTIFRHINSKFVYDCPNEFILANMLRNIEHGGYEFADNLDKRDELMKLYKLMDAGEEYKVIFEYELN